ncbi:MAG: DUF2169 domain-containing protein [Polyangiaceae bacterium]|nr:DUF2169 domain-containing protein [Polyangiaceae bacterium]
MEIIRLCPFSVATVVWGEHPTGHRLTISVKGTFVLTHRGDATIAPQQDAVHGDISWDHNPQASLFAPSDFVPYKPKIDVIFSGRAFAPGGVPVDTLAPRLQVGHLRKSLRVCGPRVWMEGIAGLGPSVPERFALAPLRYELAAMKGENRSGIQQLGSAGWPLPRIEVLDAPSGRDLTPGFGPLPVRWRAESHALSDAGYAFVRRMRSQHAVAPPNFPFSVFNCAPIEQQLDEIEPAPTIVLEHLGRKSPRLETRLPAIRPRAFLKPHGSSSTDEVDMRLDTIWIDGVRMVAVLSWRGSVPVADLDTVNLTKIVVAAESPEMMVSPEDIESPPFNYDDANIKPVLPRPFEGEAPDDEGYTLLPTKPARQGSTDLPPSAQRPPHHLDGSTPIPPSGERPIEARASTVVVGKILPKPTELAGRASAEHLPDGALRAPDAVQFSAAPGVWEPHADWRASSDAAAGPKTPRTGAPIHGDAASDAPPPTARTGAAAVDEAPATQRPGALSTGVDGTPKAGTVPPPATLPTHVIVAVRAERKAVDVAPATERGQPSSHAPAESVAISVSAVSSAKPSSMKVETVRPSGDARRSPMGASMMPMPIADVPIDVCAAVAARIDRRPADRSAILEELGLSPSMFSSAERTWIAAIRAETEQGRSELRAMYDRSYVCQLEIERGPLEVIDYVRLMIGVEHGDLDEVLAEFDVPQASLVRIERVWRERMNAEPSLFARVRQAMAGARRAFSQSQRIPSLSEG